MRFTKRIDQSTALICSARVRNTARKARALLVSAESLHLAKLGALEDGFYHEKCSPRGLFNFAKFDVVPIIRAIVTAQRNYE